MAGKKHIGNDRENTNDTIVISRKPTLMDQKQQEGKQALQQYLLTSSEASIHTAEMTAMRKIQKRKDMR